MKPQQITHTKALSEQIINRIEDIILGKTIQIKLALACLIAKGHLLIEDIPGVGKTTLAHTLAITMGLEYQRIQFTSDLLPSDITGTPIYNQNSNKFEFYPGPIFTQVLLADEVNRATPRTQSALLEAMEEAQITIEGETKALPSPFFVIATQNSNSQIGTFPLPESQLDRFLMCLKLGILDNQSERELLKGKNRRDMLATISPVINKVELATMQTHAEEIHVSEPILDYIQALLEQSRASSEYPNGLSPRAGLAILRVSKSWAMLDGKEYVQPEHIQKILPSVANHRLGASPTQSTSLADSLIKQVPIL